MLKDILIRSHGYIILDIWMYGSKVTTKQENWTDLPNAAREPCHATRDHKTTKTRRARSLTRRVSLGWDLVRAEFQFNQNQIPNPTQTSVLTNKKRTSTLNNIITTLETTFYPWNHKTPNHDLELKNTNQNRHFGMKTTKPNMYTSYIIPNEPFTSESNLPKCLEVSNPFLVNSGSRTLANHHQNQRLR
jgi:hypothetical protein